MEYTSIVIFIYLYETYTESINMNTHTARRIQIYRIHILIYLYEIHTLTFIHLYEICTERQYENTQSTMHTHIQNTYPHMGWLRLSGSLKSQVSFAKEPYKRDDNLQKKPMILSSLLIVATPYSKTNAHLCAGGLSALSYLYTYYIYCTSPRSLHSRRVQMYLGINT